MGDNLPPLALGVGRTALGVATGANYSCVLRDDGQVMCWGVNDYGQQGTGNNLPYGTLPTPIVLW